MFSTARIAEIRNNQAKIYFDLLAKSEDVVAFDSRMLDVARDSYKEGYARLVDKVDTWLLKHSWFSDDNYAKDCMNLYEKFQEDCNRLNARFEKAIADDQRYRSMLSDAIHESVSNTRDTMDWLDAEIAKMEAATK